ncbi:MAG TPA: ATP-dependent DNA ligase [Glaciihabitans sp.]|jgi:hypothetical protein|nr:ATP-dependent DNA ligase [Glaciihabitans sp.]
MGTLTYDSTSKIDFEDRVLGHLQLVIVAKLRRNESFIFSWNDDPKIGDGRSAIWLHPTIPLHFKYFGGRMPLINKLWVDALMTTANSAQGLRLVTEPLTPDADTTSEEHRS